MDVKGPLIVALDVDTQREALEIADQLDARDVRVKVGKQLFTREGPVVVSELQKRGFDVFLDLKFHDIPNTVAKAVAAAADLGVWMVNVHASGGRRMMTAAREALANRSQSPVLIAVTVLTSMSGEDLRELGVTETPLQHVTKLAALARESGMDGVVCSAQETAGLREQLGQDFKLVTPGIRLPGDDAGDQRRVVTPSVAMANGSHYLVMGRSITGSVNPAGTAADILTSLAVK
jgi:orotidine-5'-phosphate decarboxylase